MTGPLHRKPLSTGAYLYTLNGVDVWEYLYRDKSWIIAWNDRPGYNVSIFGDNDPDMEWAVTQCPACAPLLARYVFSGALS